jgi:hypothetical protein
VIAAAAAPGVFAALFRACAPTAHARFPLADPRSAPQDDGCARFVPNCGPAGAGATTVAEDWDDCAHRCKSPARSLSLADALSAPQVGTP